MHMEGSSCPNTTKFLVLVSDLSRLPFDLMHITQPTRLAAAADFALRMVFVAYIQLIIIKHINDEPPLLELQEKLLILFLHNLHALAPI